MTSAEIVKSAKIFIVLKKFVDARRRSNAPFDQSIEIVSALAIAHVQISRSARVRRCSVIFGSVRFNSNAPTNSRHALGATVSRSIVRDKRGPREVARIRERHGRARDEDGETRDRDKATGLKTINDTKTHREQRGEFGGCPSSSSSSSSSSLLAIARRRNNVDLSSRSRAPRDRSSRARTAAVKSVEP